MCVCEYMEIKWKQPEIDEKILEARVLAMNRTDGPMVLDDLLQVSIEVAGKYWDKFGAPPRFHGLRL